MLFKQLLGLTLSALISVMPTETIYGGSNITFPFTRMDTVHISMRPRVDDLGAVSVGDNRHTYLLTYEVQFHCSSACYLARDNNVAPNEISYNLTDSDVVYYNYSRIGPVNAQGMLDKMAGITSDKSVGSSYTYQSEDSNHVLNTTITLVDGITININIIFPAITDQNLLNGIYYYLRDFELQWWANQVLLDKDLPSNVITTVQNYLDNGQYEDARTYIQNYYINNSVETNENNETVINQYQSKETDLKTVTDTEHNFSIGIEDDFNDQIQAIDTENSVISNSNFQQSALWVTDKFNRFTINNAFGSILGFSLLLGLAMAIIGRVLK